MNNPCDDCRLKDWHIDCSECIDKKEYKIYQKGKADAIEECKQKMETFRIWIDATKPIRTINDCKNALSNAKRYCIYSAYSHDCYWSSDSLENCDNAMLNYTVKNISIEEDGFVRLWVNEL